MTCSDDGRLQHRSSRRELKIEAAQAGTSLRCMDAEAAALDIYVQSSF